MAPIKEKQEHLSIVETRTLSSEKRFDLLDQIQREFISRSTELLTRFYEEAEKRLFDYSRKAPSNVEEVQYFEAGQELSRQRLPISTDFLYQISKLFGLDALDRSAKSALEGLDQMDIELAVVDQEELDVEIAVKRMTSAARAQYKESLYELVQRMDVLYPDTKVDEDNNPLDPHAFASALVGSIQKLYKAPIACRAMVFKTFEFTVLKDLEPLYDHINALLKQAGVLPVIKKKYNKPVNREGPGSRKRNAEVQAGMQLDQGVPFNLTQGSLGSLMSQVRSTMSDTLHEATLQTPQGQSGGAVVYKSGVRMTGGEQSPVNFYIYTNNPGPELQSMELTDRLSEAQQTVGMDMPLTMPSNVVPIVVARALSNKVNDQQPHALNQSNEDVINLVAVFFDKILEDDNLPIEVQSLICRLQIPVLKLAIKDPKFLSNGLHPARQLINDLVRYGQKLDNSRPMDKDSVFKNMIELVNNINQQYQNDDSVFSRARADLREVLEREEKRANVVERRTRIAEEGKVKLQTAKGAAEQCIESVIEQAKISPGLVDFLRGPWLQVLVMAHLKQGKDSDIWRTQKSIVPEIVRVSEKYAGSLLVDLNLVTQDITALIEQVDSGLKIAFHDTNEKEKHLAGFETALFKPLVLSRDELAAQVEPKEEEDDGFFDDVEVAEVVAPRIQTPAADSARSAIERHQAEQAKLDTTYISLAETMPEGTWLTYCNRGGDKYVTCKLSKKIDSNLFLFVNRFGAKVHIKTFNEFAQDLQTHEAKILDSAPFFDKVMRAAMGHFTEITE